MAKTITVAIPHYNEAQKLDALLEQLLADGFHQILVLDDNSTDRTVERLAEKYPKVDFVFAGENKGPAGNRNRAIDQATGELIWFLDADMILETTGNAAKIARLFADDSEKVVGTLIKGLDGRQLDWNFGHFMHPIRDFDFLCLLKFLDSDFKQQAVAELKLQGRDYSWIDQLGLEPKSQQVEWLAEGSFVMPASIFKKIGGYDERFLYHETQDLFMRVGVPVFFDPSVAVTHNSTIPRWAGFTGNEEGESRFLFYKKYWDMPRDVFDKIYNGEFSQYDIFSSDTPK